MIYSLATPNDPGFKYLYFFQTEYHGKIAGILKEGPTVYEVVFFAVQNLNSLATHKVKPTRLDEPKCFNIESKEDTWLDPDPEEEIKWFSVKSCLFFIGKTENGFTQYRFI
ncbi:8552_t:CDS:1 [Cetraspora pellucida]|uniref:8552_t:CDS:1 n=1 Tax=Cetraspora pellucida TaxID=1433469 RepID=A0A9N9ISB3_9GLOM|nr:8552_t:CDS:1 [Cetraspora pellucida]